MDMLQFSDGNYEFIDYLVNSGYWGIFLWFLTIDNFTPIPQEISLLLIGYLSAGTAFNPILAALVCVIAFVIVDLLYFLFAQQGNTFILSLYEKNIWLERYANKMSNNMGKTIFVLCFIPRLRFVSPILIGLLKLSFTRFILFDVGSVAIFCITYIMLGSVFQETFHSLLPKVTDFTLTTFWVAISLISFFAIKNLVSNKKALLIG